MPTEPEKENVCMGQLGLWVPQVRTAERIMEKLG